MAGTKIGGQRAAETNKKKYGPGFYAEIGAIGGKKGTTGGFAIRIPCTCSVIKGKHYVVQCAGAVGGMRSRRRKSV